VAADWFGSLDCIPGVEWEPLASIDVDKLPGRDAVMRVRRTEAWGEPGEFYERHEWLTPEGRELDGAPASRRGERDYDDKVQPRTTAKRVSEALALPGIPSDYHFVILGAVEALWKTRSEDPRSFGWIEALCLADIAMIEALPDIAEQPEEGNPYDGRRFPPGPLFARLSALYVREGFLADAVAIEQRFAAIADAGHGDDVIERQRLLMEEDGR
jgi:hypothetical protein